MIKLLKKLEKDLTMYMGMLEPIVYNKFFFTEKDETDRAFHFYIIGEHYVLRQRVKKTLRDIESIQAYCLAEINGTFYSDYLKEYENTDMETKYTNNTVYEYISGCWEMLPEPSLPESIKDFIHVNASLGSKLTEGLVKFFPTAGPYKENSEGEMEKVSVFDCQVSDNLAAGAMLANVEAFNARIEKIKEIAENKGNLGEILRLIN